jgi:uncharacterized protein
MSDVILWRRLDLPGHELGRLSFHDNTWQLSGTALFVYEQRPCQLDYLVICDSSWRTNSAQVKGTIGEKEVNLVVAVDTQRRWRLNGVEYPAVAGCMDIDLGFSPSTNLLPIRRVALAVGDEAEVRAAWLPFPSLAFELLPQMYRREGAGTYRYESRGGEFVRTLAVNAVGFVTSYPGIWQAEIVT